MRISEVSATELFGVFDHQIVMKDSRITIIHGPNGVGKTVLFRMIHGLFNRRYRVFSEIPFREFRVKFDTGEAIFVEKNGAAAQSSTKDVPIQPPSGETGKDVRKAEFEIFYFNGKEIYPDAYAPDNVTSDDRREVHRLINSTTPLERLDGDLWIDPEDGTLLGIGDIIESYKDIADLYWSQERPWFTDLIKKVHTRFIRTQRLQQGQFLPSRFPYRFMRRSETSRTPNLTVERYARNIVQEIQRVSTEYAEESQKIDRVFPQHLDEEWRRLKVEGAIPKYEQDELENKLATLDNTRKKLMNLGLLAPDEAPTLVDVDEGLAGVFSIYVDDMENKFSVYNAILEKLQLLTNIINKRFQYKRLTIDKEKGFKVLALNEQGTPIADPAIPIGSLSSGEQHELVLLYQLLFDEKANTLVLIDEPEISLHVDWQDSFLDDIKEIADARGYYVLIATHSPDIIGDKDEWLVGIPNTEPT